MLFSTLKRPKITVNFTQLIALPGHGARRLAVDFIGGAKNVIWMSPQWTLYAPLLWKLFQEKNIRLLGAEVNKRQRHFWKELYHLQVFDTWIIDGYRLRDADGAFLKQLLRYSSLQVLFIDDRPYSFCNKRAHIQLSHHSYKISWSKGAPQTPTYKPCSFLKEVREETFGVL